MVVEALYIYITHSYHQMSHWEIKYDYVYSGVDLSMDLKGIYTGTEKTIVKLEFVGNSESVNNHHNELCSESLYASLDSTRFVV